MLGVEQLWNKFCSGVLPDVLTPASERHGLVRSSAGRERVRSLRGAPGYADRVARRGRAARSGRSRRAGIGNRPSLTTGIRPSRVSRYTWLGGTCQRLASCSAVNSWGDVMALTTCRTAPGRAKRAARSDGGPCGRAHHSHPARRERATGVLDGASSGSVIRISTGLKDYKQS
jgi:hypothetical protein